MIKFAKELFPIYRSITGPGQLETLKKIYVKVKKLKLIKFKSGSKIFDWKIPKEWNIKDSFIEHKSGKKFAEFKKNNLHVVSYSEPINKWMHKKELLSKIHIHNELKNAIPFVTSFYKKDWGFCMSENDKNNLPNGKYKAYINSQKTNGNLILGEFYLRGKSKKELLISTNICHPSMANNEISGIVVAVNLILYLQKTFKKKKPKFSYRFLFLPETIGCLAYISKNFETLKKRVCMGYVLSCVGDNRSYSQICSKSENNLSDQGLSASLIGLPNVKKYSYLERGSDERQYCSPNLDLPVCGFSRTKYHEYPEYHSSLDNFKVVTNEGLLGALKVMTNIFDSTELGFYPQSTTIGEPQLSKRNLYSSIGKKENLNSVGRELLNITAYSNGKNNIYKICEILNLPLYKLNKYLKILVENKLIKFKKNV